MSKPATLPPTVNALWWLTLRTEIAPNLIAAVGLVLAAGACVVSLGWFLGFL